jgi:hypothetical protein
LFICRFFGRHKFPLTVRGKGRDGNLRMLISGRMDQANSCI